MIPAIKEHFSESSIDSRTCLIRNFIIFGVFIGCANDTNLLCGVIVGGLLFGMLRYQKQVSHAPNPN